MAIDENVVVDEKYTLNRIVISILFNKLEQNNFNDIRSICKLVKIINKLIDEL